MLRGQIDSLPDTLMLSDDSSSEEQLPRNNRNPVQNGSSTESAEEIPKELLTRKVAQIELKDTVSELSVDSRLFPVKGIVLGDDSVRPLYCHVKESTCDLCLQFIRSALCTQSFEDGNRRWIWKTYGRSASYPIFKHYISKRRLKASSEAGCTLCAAVLNSAALAENDTVVFAGRRGPPGPSFRQKEFQRLYERQWWSEFSVGGLMRFMKDRQRSGNDFKYDFVFAKDEDECLLLPIEHIEDNIRTFPASHAGSERCNDQVTQWYSACKRHEKCFRRKLPLPLRILDISKKDDTHDSITLCESENIPTLSGDVEYVALSYCWGNVSDYATTMHNISERLAGFPFADLPRVVQDAVNVVRRLGIQYLWVDAYCIAQDDSAEWQHQAARMADIYGGCAFTLSALSSQDATTGFLKDRHLRPVHLGDATISYGTWEDNVKLFARRKPRSIRAEFSYCPLSKRAWPLQERILAPAVLHYARDQLIWECNENHLCSETGESADRGAVVIRTSDMTGTWHPLGRTDLWDAIVDEFTSRQLSFASDRLPAILGMAARLRQDGTRSGKYVAGLWEDHLSFELLWSVDNSGQTNYGTSVQPNLHISSWSWAHRNVRVYTHDRWGTTSVLATPPKFIIDNEEEDKQSQESLTTVPRCKIKLRGYLQRVGSTAVQVDSIPKRDMLTDSLFHSGLPGYGSGWYFDHEPLPLGPYYGLRMAEDSRGTQLGEKSIDYLVLCHTVIAGDVEGIPTSYQRVGHLHLHVMPKEHCVQPYPDVFCTNGKPLLEGGEWRDIILV